VSQPSQAGATEAPIVDASGGYIVTPAAALQELVQNVASMISRAPDQPVDSAERHGDVAQRQIKEANVVLPENHAEVAGNEAGIAKP